MANRAPAGDLPGMTVAPGPLRPVLGLVLLAVIAAVVATSVAFYDKVFSSHVTVKLVARDASSNLPRLADVKLRGLIVGSVEDTSTRGTDVTITLALDPGKAHLIPANVDAELLPTSLLGPTYVALIPPAQPSGTIAAGQTIPLSRTSTAASLENVLANSLPLLEALQPAQLTVTLREIADALEGRGAEVGRDLVQLDGVLRAINPQLPTLLDDIKATGALAGDWSSAVPDLLSALDDLDVTAATVTEDKGQLAALLSTATGTADTLTKLADADGSLFVDAVHVNRATLDLLAHYAPEYVCVLRGLVSAAPAISKAVADHELRADASLVVAPPAYTTPLHYSAGGQPSCAGLPGSAATAAGDQASPLPQLSAVGPGSRPERQAVDALVAGALHVPPSRVPPVAALLAAPLFRGAAVSVK